MGGLLEVGVPSQADSGVLGGRGGSEGRQTVMGEVAEERTPPAARAQRAAGSGQGRTGRPDTGHTRGP